MSTLKSSNDHLTLNADGTSKDIKFQADGVEKASISSAGAFTSTTIDATKLTGTIPNFTSTGIDDNATSTAVTLDSSGNLSTPNRFTMSGTGSDPGLFMGGWQIFDNASESYGPANSLAFYKGGARFAVSPSGGITFNGDTAAANTLDDYEEGSWTPAIRFGSSGTTGITYAGQHGRYTKIGDVVTWSASIFMSNKGSSTGNLQITGIPYSLGSSQSSYRVHTPVGYYGWAGTPTNIRMESNIGHVLKGHELSFATNTDLNNASEIYLAGSFRTT